MPATSPLRFCTLLLGFALALGCGDDDGGGGNGAGQGGEGHAGSHAGASGAQAGAGGGGEAGGAAGASGGGAGGDASDAGEGGSAAGSGGASGFTEMGVCGQRGQAMVGDDEFSGFEEYFLIGERGFGDDLCVVRFDVTRVGDAPPGCDDPTGDVECLWTHLVQFSNPVVVKDEGGVCSNSERALDDDAIAEIDGSQAAYGFVSEFAGHNSVLMKYDEASDSWDSFGNGTFDEEAGMFRFDYRDGFCDY